MRLRSVLAFVAISAISKSLSYDINNTRNDEGMSLSQRSLLLIPPKHLKSSTGPHTRKCQHATHGKGHVRQLEDCDPSEYTIFSQAYMPAVMSTTHGKKYQREVQPDEVDDWNNNLKIYGLWPQRSQLQSTLPFTPEAIKEVNKHTWPIPIHLDIAQEPYTKQWNKYGVKSGLSPLEYIRDINHLHQLHKTPVIIRESTTKTSISLTELKKGLDPNACLLCRTSKNEKYFLGVQYCHKVNPKTRKAEGIVVPYSNCGICAPKLPCDDENIILLKLEDKKTKCESKEPRACNEGEFTMFAQSYMPTIIKSGKGKFRREIQPDEVEDWNSHLKIHGLWPVHYKVEPSTLPFTPEAAAAVDEKEWPTMRNLERKNPEYQWVVNGVHSGLTPLEYVHETQRVHKLHPTPDILKGVFPNQQNIPLATLKTLFNRNACLACRQKDGKELFMGVRLCHKVNSKTRLMEEVVPFENCGSCALKSGCSQEIITFPKLQSKK